MVCNSCNYLSAKPLSNNSSDEIAKHLLEVIQESGRIPSLLLSDSGAAQSLGSVEKTITSLRTLVHIKNCKILRKPHQLGQQLEDDQELAIQDNLPSSSPIEDVSSDTQTPQAPSPEDDWGPPKYLSPDQIEKLMDNQNCLYRQPLSSGPPARKRAIPSSLGLVDIHCRLLGEYLMKEWSPHTSKIKLYNKILSYNIYHN